MKDCNLQFPFMADHSYLIRVLESPRLRVFRVLAYCLFDHSIEMALLYRNIRAHWRVDENRLLEVCSSFERWNFQRYLASLLVPLLRSLLKSLLVPLLDSLLNSVERCPDCQWNSEQQSVLEIVNYNKADSDWIPIGVRLIQRGNQILN